MSDVVKWGILVAGLVAIVAMILLLPIFDAININALTESISGITQTAAGALQSARGIINFFLLPVGRPILTVVIAWLFSKRLVLWSVQILSKVYTWIFK